MLRRFRIVSSLPLSLLFILGAGRAQPTISSFSPTSGPIGTTVTITGTNFNITASKDIVYLGATKGTVNSANSTSLSVNVPAGATFVPISVTDTTTGLTGYSQSPFIATFPNGGAITSSSFLPKVDYTTGINPWSVAIGDIDGDGKPDLALTHTSNSTVSVFRNTSTSGAISFASKVDHTTGSYPISVAIGDIDGDGRPDLAVTNNSSYTVSVFRNTGTIGTISFASKVDYTTGSSPYTVAIGDIDGDGKPDLAVTNYSGDTVSVFRNTSTIGTISLALKVDRATGIDPLSVAIGDIDGDGKPDLAVTNEASYTVSVFRNTSTSGTISFASKVDYMTGSLSGPRSVAIGDIDGDGKPDLATGNSNSNMVSVFRNTGTTGTISFAAKVDYTTGSNPFNVALGDIDGDGKPELVLTNRSSSTVSVLKNTVDGPPSIPQNLIVAAGNAQVTLRWSKNTEPDFLRYRIYRGTLPNPTTKVDSTTGGITDTVKTISGLTNGTTYYFRATGVDSAGNESGYSNEVNTTPSVLNAQKEYNPDANTVLLLHMNETSGSTVSDASDYGNTGTATGTTIVDGRFGKGRSYNGSSDYVQGSSSQLNFGTQDFTLEAWIRTTSPASQAIFTSTSSNLGLYLAGGAGGGFFDLDINNGTGSQTNTNGRKVNDGMWHHVAAVRIASQGFLYVDGRLDFIDNLTQNPSNSTQYRVGSSFPGSYFDGFIDEVRVSDAARSPNQFNLQLPPRNLSANSIGTSINLNWQNGGGAVPLMRYKIYRSIDSTSFALVDSTASLNYTDGQSLTPQRYWYRITAVDSTGFESGHSNLASAVLQPPALLGEYLSDTNTVLLLHMNETSGSTASDASSYGNNGTATGTTIVDGRFGKTRSFNGTTGQISIADHISLNPPSQITIEAWIKTPNTGSNVASIVSKYNHNTFLQSDQAYQLALNSPPRIPFGQLASGTSFSIIGGSRNVGTNNWNHVAVTYDGSTATIYVNGVKDGQTTFSGALNQISWPVYVGALLNQGTLQDFFSGLIDEVRVSNIARSPNEFNLQLPPRNLSANSIGTSINLNWQNGGGAVPLMRYKIYRGADSTNLTLRDSTTSTTLLDAGLAVGTYYYRISAVDSTGFESARSYAASAPITAMDLHVSTVGSDANPGTAGSPIRNIQTALDRAEFGVLIKVAAGIYQENLVTMRPVILLGGFDATFSEANRNIFSNKTIIRPPPPSGPFSAGFTDSTGSTIDGFVFDGSAGATRAIFVDSVHSIITHNVIYNFVTSGSVGIHVFSGSSAVVKNNTLSKNKLQPGGGVIVYALNVAGNKNNQTTVQNNIVFDNDVGITVSVSGIAMDYNCSFGSTYWDYDGVYGNPGPNDVLADPRLVNPSAGDMRLKASSPCNDVGNPADAYSEEPAPNGGRIDLGAYGGTKSATSAALNPSMHVSTTGNNSNPGTAAQPVRNIQYALNNMVGDTVKVAAGTYTESITTPSRSVLLGGYDQSFAQRDIFTNRTVAEATSAVMLRDEYASTIDGFLFDGRGVPTDAGLRVFTGSVVSHNIIRRVNQTFTAGIEVNGGAQIINNTIVKCSYGIEFLSGSGTPLVKNNIVAYNSYGMVQTNFTANARPYNDVFGNTFNYTGFDNNPGPNDISLNPLFVDTSAAFLDFRTASNSPCIDAGDPADPVGDEPAPNGGRIDLGTYGGTPHTPYPGDLAAPGVPVNPTISPNTWTNNSTFTISWTGPPDVSGIAKLWYRIGSPPTSVSLGTSVNAGGSSAQVTVSTNGQSTIYFYLEDGSGNKNYANYTSVIAKLDNVAPTIVHNNAIVPTFDTSVPNDIGIDASVPGELSGLQLLRLQYRKAGASWATASSVTFSAAPGTAVIPAVFLTSNARLGVDYRLVATDSAGNVTTTQPYSLNIAFMQQLSRTDQTGNPVTQTSTSSLPVGTPAVYAYRLFSVPLNLSNFSPQDAFENQTQLGAYNRESWRFFRLNSSDQFEEYPDFKLQQVLQPGVAFFLILKDGTIIRTSGGTIVRADGMEVTGIPLKAGYNLVGNPFNFDIPLDSLSINNGQISLLNRTWAFVGVGGTNNGWTPNPSILQAWEGIVINLPSGGPYTLKYFTTGRPRSSLLPSIPVAAKNNSAEEWAIHVNAERTDNGITDSENLFGVRQGATAQRDDMDMIEPPLFGESTVSLFSLNNGEPLTHEFHPVSQEGYYWDLKLWTPDDGAPVKLTFDGVEEVTSSAYLLDLDTRIAFKLGSSSELIVKGSSRKSNYRLIVGSQSYADQHSVGIDIIPRSTALYQNYPNPFNPSTVIRYQLPMESAVKVEIYNLLGERLELLVDRVEREGYYEVEWKPSLASGVYFYRLHAISLANPSIRFDQTNKMILMK